MCQLYLDDNAYIEEAHDNGKNIYTYTIVLELDKIGFVLLMS